jgi:hypothetical protein
LRRIRQPRRLPPNPPRGPVLPLIHGDRNRILQPKNEEAVPGYLQDVSVTIHSGDAQGSGTLVTRDGVAYVWTAGHVVENRRRQREVIDPKSGGKKTLVEFGDVQVVKELLDNGRYSGRIELDAEVIRYSNSETGDDLALLRVRKKNFVNVSAVFYLGADIPNIGTELLHCGSLKGQFGSNSMTRGILSQIGRVYQENVYDQTTCTAFPGSSGGGIYLKDGRYVGMLVRGSGETFNLIVPMRRLSEWADRVGVRFAIDQNAPVLSDEEMRKRPVEDAGTNVEFNAKAAEARKPYGLGDVDPALKFMIAKSTTQPSD